MGARLLWGRVQSLTGLLRQAFILAALCLPIALQARVSDDSCEGLFLGRNSNPTLLNSPDQVLYDLLRTNGIPPEIHHRYVSRKGPMFWIADEIHHSEPEEQNGTLQYAINTYKQNREWIFFLPAFHRDSVPGFDGIILDSYTSEPVANYLHKSSYFSRPEDVTDAVMGHLSTALQKSKRFSKRSAWLNMLTANDLYGSPESETMRRYRGYVARARSLIEFFGMDVYREEMRSRPTRILIDLIPQQTRRSRLKNVVTSDLIHRVRYRIREHVKDVDKVVLQVGNEIHEITPPMEVSGQQHLNQAM